MREEQKNLSLYIMSKREILIIFDIDETLLQFINKKAYHHWEAVTEEQKRMIINGIEFMDSPEKKQVIFFRPGLREFLEMVKSNKNVKIALWTYSEREYAEDIANILSANFDVPKDIFLFTYGSEDIIDHDIPKSLEQIWNDDKYKNKFNKFNTFLLDDRLGNLCHKINENNGILVQAFAPFGETKQREKTTCCLLEKAINDPMFKILNEIIVATLKDIKGCTDKEINEAFDKESVFDLKCSKRKNIDKYIKNYGKCSLITIGDVSNAASVHKGGKTKLKSRKSRKKRVKSRVYKSKKVKRNRLSRKSKKYSRQRY